MKQQGSFEDKMANRQDGDLTRSEKVRARRQKNRKESVKPPFGSSATRKQTQRSVPVTRRKPYSPPVVNRKRGSVPIPLKSKGAEVQLPAIPRIQLGRRLISGAIFLLSLVAVVSFASVSTFKVSSVNLEGAERLSGDVILSQVHLQGEAIIKIQPREIEAQISERFPSLSAVRVSIRLPANLTVQVTERQPLILWQQDGSSLWIDSEGVMFPVRGKAEVPLTVVASSDPPGVPTPEQVTEKSEEPTEIQFDPELLATWTTPQTTPEFVKGVLMLSPYLPENTALQYDPEFGLGWQDPGGWLVYFGRDIKEIEDKLAEYQAIVEILQEKNLTPSLISLEFVHAPFYRLEQ